MSHPAGITIAVLAALAAAGAFGAAAALQHRQAQLAPRAGNASFRLLARLAGWPLWLAGILLAAEAYGLQALALAFGPLALVAPIVATDLLFALPVAARWSGPLRRADWLGGGLASAGSPPSWPPPRRHRAGPAPRRGTGCWPSAAWRWRASSRCARLGRAPAPPARPRRPGGATPRNPPVTPRPRFPRHGALPARGSDPPEPPGDPKAPFLRHGALVLTAVAAGAVFGLTAAVTLSFTRLLRAEGADSARAHWQPWVLMALGTAGLLQSASAFQAGALGASLPVMDTVEPVTGVLLGTLLFGERLAASPAGLAVQVAGAAAAVAGITVLGRSAGATAARWAAS